jgi:hypothetical protein
MDDNHFIDALRDMDKLETLTHEQVMDLQEVRQLDLDSAAHTCIWSKTGPIPLQPAKRLAMAGLIHLEDSNRGPMVTRTYKGTNLIRQWLEVNRKSNSKETDNGS